LPPSFHFDPGRLAHFFALLSRTTREAASLARRHDARMNGRSWLKTDADRPPRHALEIRHDSFRDPPFIALLPERRESHAPGRPARANKARTG
jgi:uncharacterized protein YecE (DUF72 family)